MKPSIYFDNQKCRLGKELKILTGQFRQKKEGSMKKSSRSIFFLGVTAVLITIGLVFSSYGNSNLFASSKYRFLDMKDGTVLDSSTGLIWLKNANGFGFTNWTKGAEAIAKLKSGECGLTDGSKAGDWRFPTKEELSSIIDKRFSNPAISNAKGDAQWTEGDVFVKLESLGFYWTSDACDDCKSPEETEKFGRCISMHKGFEHIANQGAYGYHAWPVKGGN